MRICGLFDKYRDNELDVAQRSEFELHLSACEDCRARKSLLDNVAYLIRSEEIRPLDIADRVARRAFQRNNSWASAVISWLHPVPALAALAFAFILFSSLWIISGNGKVSAYSEYETLMEEVDAGDLNAFVSKVHSDSELVLWLEQGGNLQ
jgi:anti-sigma factor RsiW